MAAEAVRRLEEAANVEEWGSSFSVGVEEEPLLVDATTHALVHNAEAVMSRIQADDGAVGHEAYAAQLELRSPPCDAADGAVRALASARAAARSAGATLMGAGLHPTGALGDVELVPGERYSKVERSIRGLMWRTPESALHVHVGAPDRQVALRIFNGLREWLPLLEGIAANSPWWFARDAGMASARAAVVRARPGVELPPAFASWDQYLEALAAIHSGGGPADYRSVWWHLRPHPRLGTVEVRQLDAQSRLEDVAAITTLIQGLALRAAEEPVTAPSPSAALAWSSFRAARDGLAAEILDGDRLVPLRDAASRALGLARPAARELGAEDALTGVDRILREGGGADRRRAAYERGGMEEMLRELVEETAAP